MTKYHEDGHPLCSLCKLRLLYNEKTNLWEHESNGLHIQMLHKGLTKVVDT